MNYRFKIPGGPPCPGYYSTYSFGIEPCKLNSRGQLVKAGAAVVRIVIEASIPESRDWAARAADDICKRLNEGHAYKGPKTLRANRLIHTSGYF
jgi:hypothetical protein